MQTEGKLRQSVARLLRMFAVLSCGLVMTACAAQKELRAPCGPLTAYVDEDCGNARPVNEIFEKVGSKP